MDADVAAVVERALGDDLRACAELACTHTGGDVQERSAAFADWLDDPTRCLFVAKLAGVVVGYGKADYFTLPADSPPATAPEGYYLGGLVVMPDVRRRGIGATLTRARMTWAAERASELWYFTNARNRASLALHAALGFTEVTRAFEYPGVSFAGGVGVLCRASLEDHQ